eukprot:TRINITY_DN3806_c0_g2_i1.p1 TRINITY_DN3806_c0_g2~~TRINITY_DN3806_c0_g2_i1.p1  ORF type:complete len:711 (+),score=97.85 TRINITY_DN3806_c0_g2_i1:86-2218(+)
MRSMMRLVPTIAKCPYFTLLRKELLHCSVGSISISKRTRSIIASDRVSTFCCNSRVTGLLRHRSSTRCFSTLTKRIKEVIEGEDEEIRALCDENRIDEAYKRFLEKRNLPDATLMVTKFLELGTSKFLNFAMHTYQALIKANIKPDAAFYAILIRFCQKRDPELVEDLFSDMQELKIKPDQNCLLNMAISASKTNNIGFGKEILKALLEGGMEIPPRSLTPMFHPLLELFLRRTEFVAAHAVVEFMLNNQIYPDKNTFALLLKTHIQAGPPAYEFGKEVEEWIKEYKYNSRPEFVQLIAEMHEKCGKVEENNPKYKKVTDEFEVKKRWNSFVEEKGKEHSFESVLEVYETMVRSQLAIPVETYVSVLNAISHIGKKELSRGVQIHHNITNKGLHTNLDIVNGLLQMYNKCGNPLKSIEIFNELLITDIKPNITIFCSAVQACIEMGKRGLEIGKYLHNLITTRNLTDNILLYDNLILMYAKCGEPAKAIEMFESQLLDRQSAVTRYTVINTLRACTNLGGPEGLKKANLIYEFVKGLPIFNHSPVICSSLIHAFLNCGAPQKAIEIFDSMVENKVIPDSYAYTFVLTAISQIEPKPIQKGIEVHRSISKNKRWNNNVIVLTSLIQMYRNVGEFKKALSVFNVMIEKGIEPNPETFAIVLSTINQKGPENIEKGNAIEDMIRERKLQRNPYIWCALKEMHTNFHYLKNKGN